MFEEFTFDALMDRMLTHVSDDLDKREGSIIYDALAPAALELAELYGVLEMTLNEAFADTASYYYLIKRAAERGLFPKEAAHARCKMVVTPEDSIITTGDRFNMESLNYTVKSAIDGEPGAYVVECETEGMEGNQQLGELIPIETEDELNNLETAAITEILIPGEDEEDVESFRERYFASFETKAFGGNREDYKQRVNDIEGVGNCKVKRAWSNGYAPSDMIPAQEVKDWFSGQSELTVGKEVYAWMNTVYNAASEKLLTVGGTVHITVINAENKAPSDTLIKAVQNQLDPDDKTGEGMGAAPIGHVIKVNGVRNMTVDVGYEITYENGYTYADIIVPLSEAIDGYFEQLRGAWADLDNLIVRVSKLETIALSVKGVADILKTTINGAEQNLMLDQDCIPVRGEING